VKVAELIAALNTRPADSLVCLDCLRCGHTVVGEVEIETPEYMPDTVWLAEES
jgi:hypothetical protein